MGQTSIGTKRQRLTNYVWLKFGPGRLGEETLGHIFRLLHGDLRGRRQLEAGRIVRHSRVAQDRYFRVSNRREMRVDKCATGSADRQARLGEFTRLYSLITQERSRPELC